jgi:hypothetical protein
MPHDCCVPFFQSEIPLPPSSLNSSSFSHLPFSSPLSIRHSPYSGSIVDNNDDVSDCGNGPDQGFLYMLQPGERIRVGQTSNTFDSRHSLRIGGVYPGDAEHLCSIGSNLQKETYANFGTSEVAVYFIIDTWDAAYVGDFVLEWNVISMKEGGHSFRSFPRSVCHTSS